MCIFIFISCNFLSISDFKQKVFVGKNSRKHYKLLPHRVEVRLIILKSLLKLIVIERPQNDEYATIQEFIIFFNGCLDLSASFLIHNMVLVRNVK